MATLTDDQRQIAVVALLQNIGSESMFSVMTNGQTSDEMVTNIIAAMGAQFDDVLTTVLGFLAGQIDQSITTMQDAVAAAQVQAQALVLSD